MLTGNNMAKNLQPKETSSKIKSVKNIKEPLSLIHKSSDGVQFDYLGKI